VNGLVDIIVVTTLVVLAAVASIVLTSSYKKLWRSSLKNGSTLSVAVPTNLAPSVDNPNNVLGVVDAVQVPTPPMEENQVKQEEPSSKPTEAPQKQEKPIEPPANLEQPAPIASVEVEQQIKPLEEPKEVTPQIASRATRRKRSAARTRATGRTRKKALPGTQQTTESQPSS